MSQSSGPNFNFTGASIAGGVAGGDYTGDVIHHHASKGNLAETAAEIQQLLEQLSKINPTETLPQQMTVATQAIERVQQNPQLLAKLVAALKEGGTSALESALNHPVASFFISAAKSLAE